MRRDLGQTRRLSFLVRAVTVGRRKDQVRKYFRDRREKILFSIVL